MKKVVLAGGSGNLGKLLTAAFVNNGWYVIILTRTIIKKDTTQISWVKWDGKSLDNWVSYLEGTDVIINLSGKSIQCRFTERNKEDLYSSRIWPTKVLGEAISQLVEKPRLWINFSGISLFNKLDKIQDEHSTTIGKGFLAELTKDWEAAFFESRIDDVAKVALRISPVLYSDSGFFTELLPLVKFGLGGHVGNGGQWMNWIHYTDLINLVFWIIEKPNPNLIYHACSPHPSTNSDFMREFRKSVGASFGLPMPSLLAKIGAFIKGVDPSLLLDSVPVTTISTIDQGFVFQYPNAKLAIKQLLNQNK